MRDAAFLQLEVKVGVPVRFGAREGGDDLRFLDQASLRQEPRGDVSSVTVTDEIREQLGPQPPPALARRFELLHLHGGDRGYVAQDEEVGQVLRPAHRHQRRWARSRNGQS